MWDKEIDFPVGNGFSGDAKAVLCPPFLAEQALMAVSDPMKILNREMRIVWANEAVGIMTKRSTEEIIGCHCYEVFHGSNIICDDCPVEKSFRTGGSCMREKFVDQPSGVRAWTEIRAWPIRGAGGQVTHVVECARDITGRKEGDAAVREIEWLLTKRLKTDTGNFVPSYGDLTSINSCRMIADNVDKEVLRSIVSEYLHLLDTSSAVYEKNGDYALGIFASSWCRFLDQASRNLCGTDDNQEALASGNWLCHESCWKASRMAMETAKAVDVECYGGIRLFAMPILSGGEIIGSINFGYGDPPKKPDKLKEIADRYDVSESELRKLSYDYKSRPPFFVNLAKKRLSSSASLIGTLMERKKVERELLESKKRIEKTNQRLKENQDQLVQSEKMASIGQLAAGVAHEINNPVAFIDSNLRTLQEYRGDLKDILDRYIRLEEHAAKMADSSEDDALTGILDEVRSTRERIELEFLLDDFGKLIAESREGTERVKKIVQDLKDFSHAGEAELKWADLNKGMESTLNVVWNELKYKATVIKDLGDIPEIYCYPQQMNQVFMNILVNAAQAIEERGEIRIKTQLAEGDRPMVEVKISDTGKGIAPEHLQKVFDPFFTTKPVGKGTGLGMSMAYKIVKKHHGTIKVNSEIGKGSTFIIRLPVNGPEDDKGVDSLGNSVTDR